MRLVLSLPNSDVATAIWTNEMNQAKYLDQLKQVYDVVILLGNDAVANKWWQYNTPDTIYAGVGHGNFFIYTGQNQSTIMTNDSTDIARFNAAAFCPVSCLVWNGKASICQKLAEKGVPIVIGEEIEYSLTDGGVSYYVSAEVNILYNLPKCQTYNDLRQLIDKSYDEQIQKAISANDYFDASILKDDKEHRLCALNKPLQPPQPTESYVTFYVYDKAGYPLENVTVTCKETGEVHNTANWNWTSFRLELNKTYTFIFEKEGYVATEKTITTTAEKMSFSVYLEKAAPPNPPPPPQPKSTKFEGKHKGEFSGIHKSTIWLGPFKISVTGRVEGQYVGDEAGEIGGEEQ